MKNLKFLGAFLLAAIISSCLDTEENIVLNADHSGTYSMKLDLGRMLKMAASLGAENSNPDKVKEKRDTTIFLRDLMNDTDSLTVSEKELYKNGKIYLKLDEANDEMKIEMSSPFKNGADLMEIKKNFSTVLNKLKAFDKATGEKSKSSEGGGDITTAAKSANPVSEQFTFMAGAGIISNTITNIAAFKETIAGDSTLGMMTQMTSMMGDFNYKTIIVLPGAVKKYEGPASSVSADKKTLTFSTTLSEMLENPEKVSYKVEY